ncbi:MAG TPA: PLDc N-terminal domain-containing protein [Chitinophagaceae bacterium]|jgi:hypothetical protein
MRNFSKPVFILGCASLLVGIIGFVMTYNLQYETGRYVFGAGLAGIGIFWLWSIAQVASTDDLKNYQKMFWLIIVISVPLIGGFIYLIMHQRRNKIVT